MTIGMARNNPTAVAIVAGGVRQICGLSALLLTVTITGCTTIGVRTEGTSGPLTWHATDLSLVEKVVAGQDWARQDYTFTLVFKNTSDSTITLTRVDHTVYQAGSGQPGHGSTVGRLELKPNAEQRLPFSTYVYCLSYASLGCRSGRGTLAPLWKVVFTGTDDRNRPVRIQIDIALPAEPARAPLELSARLKPSTPSVATHEVAAPEWKPGYEWDFRWKSPRGEGSFGWLVDRVEVLDGTEFYIIRVLEYGAFPEIYYRKSDLAYYMDKVFEGIEERNIPPVGASWPLNLGKTWEVRYARERPIDRQTEQMVRTCRVEAVERIGVPAGLFDTWRIVCRDPQSAVVTEVWYSPEVKHWVKERTWFRYGLRERELTKYRVE